MPINSFTVTYGNLSRSEMGKKTHDASSIEFFGQEREDTVVNTE